MRIATMNGWKMAPNMWRRHLTHLPRVEKTPGWICVSCLGISLFFISDSYRPDTTYSPRVSGGKSATRSQV
jgi:hypothetical protein